MRALCTEHSHTSTCARHERLHVRALPPDASTIGVCRAKQPVILLTELPPPPVRVSVNRNTVPELIDLAEVCCIRVTTTVV
jgi:hypothetical protein